MLLLTGAFLPHKVVDYIKRKSFASFSFNFIPIKDIPGVRILIDWIEFDQPVESLIDVGLESGSSRPNILSLLFILLLILILHLVLIVIPRFKIGVRSSKFRRAWNFVILKGCEMLTFGVYIRIVMEAYQYLLLAGISELRNIEDLDTAARIISAIIAIFLTLL